MPDQASTATEGAEQVGRFRISVVRGEPMPETDALWQGRAIVLARWLVSEWKREREDAGRARIEPDVNSERGAGA